MPPNNKATWHETHILPSGLSKLAIPRTCSLHTQKAVNCEPSLTMQEQDNSPAHPGGGADDGNMTSTQERKGSSPSPLSSSDYKNVTH